MILKNREEFIKSIPTAAAGCWEDMETYRDSAERWLRNELLGQVLYRLIDVEPERSEHVELLGLCRKVISLDAYQRAIPFLDLIQTANGFGIISNQNLAPASRDRVDRLLRETIIQRDGEVEELLDYLEDTPALHDAWKGAKSYSILSDCLIMTAKELHRLCAWEGTRQDFIKLKPVLMLRMYNEIGRWFGRTFIDELVEQQRDGDLTAANIIVLDILKVSLANFATGNVKDAETFLSDVVTMMDRQIDEYPTYGKSQEYQIRHKLGCQNTKDSPIYIMGGL